jgi:predicted nucleotidyltransferase
MTSEELLKLLNTHGAKYVYETFLLNEDVFLLRDSSDRKSENYHHFKMEVSKALDVPLKNIAIVGSAKTGYSLTPGRNFDPYGPESDLDLVVVSGELFRELWGTYLELVGKSIGKPYNEIAKNVFRHFVSIKVEELTGIQVELFASWIARVGVLKRQLQLNFRLPAEINYRIYEDWRFVEKYHVVGLNQLSGNV